MFLISEILGKNYITHDSAKNPNMQTAPKEDFSACPLSWSTAISVNLTISLPMLSNY